MTMYNTLLLDTIAWDLVIDSAGNIAVSKPKYSLAQDVACAIRLFLGELWYDQGKGIPYFEEILGKLPPLSLITGHIERVAMTVPGVVKAQCLVTNIGSTELSGELIFIDEEGSKNAVRF